MQSQKIYFWDQSYMLICIIYCVIFRRNFSMFNEDNRATYENILAEFLFLKFEVSKNIHFRGLRHCIHLISQPLKQNAHFSFSSPFSQTGLKVFFMGQVHLTLLSDHPLMVHIRYLFRFFSNILYLEFETMISATHSVLNC